MCQAFFFWHPNATAHYILRVGLRGPKAVLDDKAAVVRALRAARWVLKHAAQELGVSRQTLYAAMERHGIKRRPMSPEYLSERNRQAAQAPRPPRRSAA